MSEKPSLCGKVVEALPGEFPGLEVEVIWEVRGTRDDRRDSFGRMQIRRAEVWGKPWVGHLHLDHGVVKVERATIQAYGHGNQRRPEHPLYPEPIRVEFVERLLEFVQKLNQSLSTERDTGGKGDE